MPAQHSHALPCSECPDLDGIVHRAVYTVDYEVGGEDRNDPVCALHLGRVLAYATTIHTGFVPVTPTLLVPAQFVVDTTRELVAA